MQIKDPKFKEGQKVRDIEDGDIYTVVEINRYSFSGNEYWYELEADRKEYTYTRPESKLIDKPKTVWDLKKDDDYFLIFGDGKVSETTWGDCTSDKKFREIGNVFLTKAEAEFERERRRIETEMLKLGGRRKINELNSNIVYTIQMHFGLKYVYVRSFDIEQAPIGVIFFNYRKQAIKALETIGEGRIKKYIFGVE